MRICEEDVGIRMTMLFLGCMMCFSAVSAFAENPSILPWFVELSDPRASVEQKVAELTEIVEELKEQVKKLQEYAEANRHFPLPERVTLCGEEIPIHDPIVREALDKQLLLFSREPRQIATWMKRSGKFFDTIERVRKKVGLPCADGPQFLAVAESGLQEHAYSRAGAAGYYQFMKATGRRYDLRASAVMDERFDVERSAESAMKYLRDLHKQFQNWPLAIAAYNAGEVKVERLLENQNAHDYWHLIFFDKRGRRTETNEYVYRIIAIKLIFENPERYGFFLNEQDYFRPTETIVQVKRKVSGKGEPLLHFLREYSISLLEFWRLNPAVRSQVISRGFLPKGEYLFLVPKKEKNSP